MALDKELYRKAYESLRQWNELETLDNARSTAQLTPQEAWRRYAALWAFCVKLSPPQTELQNQLWMAKWEEYYANIRKLEAWRRAHGRAT